MFKYYKFLILFGLISSPVRADFIPSVNATVERAGDNDFLYMYDVENDPLSDRPIVSFALEVSNESELRMIDNPEGWLAFYRPGDPVILWEIESLENGISPGSIARFSFTSVLGPSDKNYTLGGLDLINFEFAFSEGLVSSPSSTLIPEPSAFLQTGVGLIGLVGGFGWWHRRWKRSQASIE